MPTASALTLRDVAPTPLRNLAGAGPEGSYVLAVDLGTGGPKVAVISATGRIAAHAFESVPISLGADGAAEQAPGDWWNAITCATRRALDESGVAPDGIVGVGCTAQWSGTVAVGADGDAIGPSIIWLDSRGANAVRRTVRGALNVQGYSPAKAARWVRRTGGIPSLSIHKRLNRRRVSGHED
jgi:xylulokinase